MSSEGYCELLVSHNYVHDIPVICQLCMDFCPTNKSQRLWLVVTVLTSDTWSAMTGLYFIGYVHFRYCDQRRRKLLEHVHEGYEKDWWEYSEP